MEIKDVENLVELARLEMSQEEKEAMLHDFEGILKYIDSIKEAKVDDVDLKLDNYNAWREDEVIERDFDKDSIIKQFPNEKDGFLQVKKILKND